MAAQMQEIADASRELERSKIEVQLKLFTEQMEYQREKDRRMYENAAIANENARMAIRKQGEMVSCLSQLSSVLSTGLSMSTRLYNAPMPGHAQQAFPRPSDHRHSTREGEPVGLNPYGTLPTSTAFHKATGGSTGGADHGIGGSTTSPGMDNAQAVPFSCDRGAKTDQTHATSTSGAFTTNASDPESNLMLTDVQQQVLRQPIPPTEGHRGCHPKWPES